MSGFLTAFQAKLSTGEIEQDPGQSEAVNALDDLSNSLEGSSGGDGWFHRHKKTRGLYLWGAVGRGKSMLMDLFEETVGVSAKRRIHFHAFMQEVHTRLQQRQAAERQQEDAIMAVAADLGREARLLCLDELEITDMGDATIVGRLFDGLFEAGATIVATSNDQPDDLYKGGPNRDGFLPFIERIKSNMRAVEISGGLDRRDGPVQGHDRYFCPLDAGHKQAFDAAWSAIVGNRQERPVELETHGHKTSYARAAGPAIRVTFAETCERPLSADDHLTCAAHFGQVYLDGIPRLDRDREDAARRLVTLVDALYEAGCKLVVLAAVEPDHLFEDPRPEEYQRTASRLKEMRQPRWPGSHFRRSDADEGNARKRVDA